jgi:hypothetical protein
MSLMSLLNGQSKTYSTLPQYQYDLGYMSGYMMTKYDKV